MVFVKLSEDALSVIEGMSYTLCSQFPDSIDDNDIRLLSFLGQDSTGIAKNQKQKIRDAFSIAEIIPVEVPTIGTFNGGWESAARLYNGLNLAREANLPSMSFYDIDNVAHDLDLVTALQVCIAVGSRFKQDFDKKQSLMQSIDTILADTGKTEAEKITAIEAVAW